MANFHSIRHGIAQRWSFGFLCLTFASAVVATPGIDQRVIGELLQIEQQLHATEIAQETAPRLGIQVRSQSAGLRVRTVRVQIDDDTPTEYEYAQPEWDALAMGASHPAWQGNVAPGPHRLRVEISARSLDANPNDARTLKWIDQTIEIDGNTAIDVTLTQKRFGPDELQVDEVNPVDAALNAAKFWLWSDRPLIAARTLARAQARYGGSGEIVAWQTQSQDRFVSPLAPDQTKPLLALSERYQQGIQQLAAGNVETLQALSALKAESEPEWVIRDHANLMLGYHALRQAQADRAREALGRVRSPGPRASEAMLGYGWTFLIDDRASDPVTDDAPTDHPAFVLSAQSTANDDNKKAREKALRAALVPWTELIGTHPLDVAAQEGALGVAWLLEELDTGAQAYTYYERSAARLERGRQLLDEAMEHIASGAAANAFASGQNDERSGWHAWLSDMPYDDDTAYMRYLLKEPAFVVALENYRAERALDDALQNCANRAASVASVTGPSLNNRISRVRSQLEPTLNAARTHMERLALDRLRGMKERIERYLAHARFAMARQFDSAEPTDTLALMETAP